MRHNPKIFKTVVMSFALMVSAASMANESSEHFYGDLDKLDCAKFDAAMRSYLRENREHVASLATFKESERRTELRSYQKALSKAEGIANRCVADRKAREATLVNVSYRPRKSTTGLYAVLNANLDYVVSSGTDDPYVFERLTRSYDDLLSAYGGAGK